MIDPDDLAAAGDDARKRKREEPESDTPRTDANLRGWLIPAPFMEFTRQLEREWNTVRYALAAEMNRREAAERLLRAAQERELAAARAPSPEAASIWRDPKDKPPHLPGEHHSQSVLLLMKRHGWIDEERIKIGHVSVGHWRPSGGNGNFDDDVEGWMPLPSVPSAALHEQGEKK